MVMIQGFVSSNSLLLIDQFDGDFLEKQLFFSHNATNGDVTWCNGDVTWCNGDVTWCNGDVTWCRS